VIVRSLTEDDAGTTMLTKTLKYIRINLLRNQISGFYDVTSCILVETELLLYLEERGKISLRNSDTFLPDYMASHPQNTLIFIFSAMTTSNLMCGIILFFYLCFPIRFLNQNFVRISSSPDSH
jgi:hypothetical protein